MRKLCSNSNTSMSGKIHFDIHIIISEMWGECRGAEEIGKYRKIIRAISLNVRDNAVKSCLVLKVPWYFWRKRRFCAMTVACNTK